MTHSQEQSPATLADHERALLANELHDTVMPLLFAASAGTARLVEDAAVDTADQLSSEERGDRLQQVASWIADAMLTSRGLMRQAYLPADVVADWCETLRQSTTELLPELDIQWNVGDGIKNACEESAVTAYRVSFEAIRNASRHTDSSVTFDGSLTRDGSGLVVLIRDSGRGFDPDVVTEGHHGIKAMKSRVQLAGGTFDLTSKPGSGTTVQFTIPRSKD